MGWQEIRVQVHAIEGFLSDTEAKCLYYLAKNCGGTIIEIGSFKGKSSVCLALASKAGSGGKVFAIDPHKGLKDDCAGFHLTEDTESIFKENIRRAKVNDIVIPLVMKSENAINIWSEPISLEDRILKFQKFLLYYYLPLAYVTLALVSRVLAKAGLLGSAKLIKEKISTLIYRRSHYR